MACNTTKGDKTIQKQDAFPVSHTSLASTHQIEKKGKHLAKGVCIDESTNERQEKASCLAMFFTLSTLTFLSST